jgi:hypothetical protein
LDALGLDFDHLSEEVHAARREISGDDEEAGTEWAGDRRPVVQHDGDEAAGSPPLEWRSALQRGRAAAARLVNDVSERREMIRDPEFRSEGRPIGRGPTEATCPTLPARLKGSGMRRGTAIAPRRSWRRTP